MSKSKTTPNMGRCITFLSILLTCGITQGQDAVASDKSMTSDLCRIKQFLENNKPAVWLFAGDSVTFGSITALDGNRDYVQLFEQRLRREMNLKEHIVIKTAASGWTISSLDNRLQWYFKRLSPDVISINFGMNDCYEALSDPNALEKWKVRYQSIIDRIKSANIPIIIHTPNAMHPESQSSDIKKRRFLPEYVKAIRELAQQNGTVLIDNYSCWQNHIKRDACRFWMSDDIHPDCAGHRVIAQELFKAIGIYDPNSPTCQLFIPRYP